MGTDARVVVLPVDDGPLRLEKVTLPSPGPHQVVVRQLASGVCHSQLHQMHSPRTAPVVLGHESTGVVLEVGSAVSGLAPGDDVFVTWVPRREILGDRQAEATRLALPDGTTAVAQNVFTWADNTIADEAYVVKVPHGTPMETTAIIGCAVMTGAGAVIHTANVGVGQSVAVIGVGGVGLSAVAAARIAGADPIIALDTSDEKLAFAARFGATVGVNVTDGDPIARVRELTGGGVDFSFDCIGHRVTMEQLLPLVRGGVLGGHTGGTGVLVGVPLTPVELDARDVLLGEKIFRGSIGGSCHPTFDFPLFLRWYEQGRFDLDALVTERFALEDINEATDKLGRGKIFGRAILTM